RDPVDCQPRARCAGSQVLPRQSRQRPGPADLGPDPRDHGDPDHRRDITSSDPPGAHPAPRGRDSTGMSDFECARRVTLPWVNSGIIGAAVLGLGRALGETIAVAMVCGVALGTIPTNLYQAMITIAANIVQNLDSAIESPLGIKTYAELGLALMAITLLTNVAARLLVRRVSGTAPPVGMGL